VITTMFTSRGCPYRCTFCDRPYSPVLSGFRCRSAGHVADEMEVCLSLRIREAFIYDDTFTVRRDRVFELCDEIDRRGIKFRWDVRAHVNTMTPELLSRMKQAGCDRIHYGVECGNDRMLKVIKKNATIGKVREVVAATKKVGMEVLCYFIIGQQTETASTLRTVMRWHANWIQTTCTSRFFAPILALRSTIRDWLPASSRKMSGGTSR